MFKTRSSNSRFFMLLAVLAAGWLGMSVAVAGDIEIFQPGHEETVHDNSGNVTVEIMAVLDRGQRIRLLIDGASAAPDSRNLTFNLEGIDRGTHTLKALILDREGTVVAESEPVVFYMWQASRQFPNRAR